MTDDEIYDRLNEIFRDVFGEDQLTLHPHLTAADVAGWDSLQHVRLILTIERQFKQKYPASRIAELKNVGELVALIKSYS